MKEAGRQPSRILSDINEQLHTSQWRQPTTSHETNLVSNWPPASFSANLLRDSCRGDDEELGRLGQGGTGGGSEYCYMCGATTNEEASDKQQDFAMEVKRNVMLSEEMGKKNAGALQ